MWSLAKVAIMKQNEKYITIIVLLKPFFHLEIVHNSSADWYYKHKSTQVVFSLHLTKLALRIVSF